MSEANRSADHRVAVIQEGWDLMKKNFWFLASLVLITGIVSSISGKDKDGMTLIGFIFSIISIFISIGILKIVFNLIDKKKLDYADLYENTKYFWRYLGASLLYGLIVGIGIILLIVPGIYFGVKYQFAMMLIVDKDMGIKEAFNKSAEMTEGKTLNLLVFDFMLAGVVILGAIALGIGLFAAVPTVWIAAALLYRKMSA